MTDLADELERIAASNSDLTEEERDACRRAAECLGMHIEAVRLGQRLSRLEAAVRDVERVLGAGQGLPKGDDTYPYRIRVALERLAAALGENGEVG